MNYLSQHMKETLEKAAESFVLWCFDTHSRKVLFVVQLVLNYDVCGLPRKVKVLVILLTQLWSKIKEVTGYEDMLHQKLTHMALITECFY